MYFSILGDSISTYYGYNPKNFSVFYDQAHCLCNGLNDVTDTWWSQVISHFNGELSVNNSYSGCRVTGNNFPAANSMTRLNFFKAGIVPDYILVYIGFNDFGYGVMTSKEKLSFSKNPLYFKDAYQLLLKNLKKLLPDTKIICGTLMETYIKYNSEWQFPTSRPNRPDFDEYNDIISHMAAKESVYLADLHQQSKYETLDGTHPTVQGHQELANAWINELESKKLIKRR